PPHLAIQAEHGNRVRRIGEVARLDHVVLLVAAQPVLRPERRRERQSAREERVHRMREAFRDRGRVREEREAPALEALLQRTLLEQALDAEFQASSSAKPSGWWKSGRGEGCRNAQYESVPSRSSITAQSATRSNARSTAMVAESSNPAASVCTAIPGSGTPSGPPSR